jgi:6-phosphogluconolactonase
MKGALRILDSTEALDEVAAAEFLSAAQDAVHEHDSFRVALAGGATPITLYAMLATDPRLRAQLPWKKLFFFFGDERHVPPDHPGSNFRMAQEALFSKVSLMPGQVFRIKGEYPDADQAATEYEQTLRDYFHLAAGQCPRFDLILLGLGPDGHTASLFPGTRALREEKRLVVSNWVEKLATNRITMTVPVLNNAARVIFLIQGEEKASALKAVLDGPRDPEQLPAQLIQPVNGRLLWLVDKAAARFLSSAMQRTAPIRP